MHMQRMLKHCQLMCLLIDMEPQEYEAHVGVHTARAVTISAVMRATVQVQQQYGIHRSHAARLVLAEDSCTNPRRSQVVLGSHTPSHITILLVWR
jgi:hypothetical protein